MRSSNSSSSKTWCDACSEHCFDHPSMCTICGESLIYAPSPTGQHQEQQQLPNPTMTGILRQQIPTTTAGGEIWQTPPPEAMNPQPDDNP